MKITAELRAQARMIADAPEGAELQESTDGCPWRDSGGGVLLNRCPDFLYRIKPEPRVIYVNEFKAPVGFIAFTNKEAALINGHRAERIAVEYREVVK